MSWQPYFPLENHTLLRRKKRFVNDLSRTVLGCIGVTDELKVFIGDLKVIDVKLWVLHTSEWFCEPLKKHIN